MYLELIGGLPTPLKNMNSSVGMMTFPIYGKIKFTFQTTNQILSGKLTKLLEMAIEIMDLPIKNCDFP